MEPKRSIGSIVWEARRKKGDGNEFRVVKAVEHLIEEGELDSMERSSKLDRKGIDLLAVRGSKKYKLSVKSSDGGIKHELENHPERHRHGDRLFIVPRRDEAKEELGNRILKITKAFEEKMHKK